MRLNPKSQAVRRVLAGFGFALTVAISAYILIDATQANRVALGSIWFLAVLPAFLCALICYVGDPDGDRPTSFYWSVPLVLVGIVVCGSAIVLREGVICLIMLSPIWLISGWIGAFAFRFQRKRVDANTLQCSVFLLPLMTGVVESQIPYPNEHVDLVRRIVVQATPEEIWPFTLENEHIATTEGRWTFTQNIVGVPRPLRTRLQGSGPGAVRTAYWGDGIDFDEVITDWQPEHRLAWNFSFSNSSIKNFPDQHMSPDGQFLKIVSGDYTLTPVGPGQTLLTLHTHYIAKTHVNTYAKLWGEILMGDVQNNILAILQQRAEAQHRLATAAVADLGGAP